MSTEVAVPDNPDRRSRSADECLFRDAVEYIDTRLSDSELDPSAVADSISVSTRTLNRLFRQHEATVRGWILSRRLEQAHRDLADPALAQLTVAEIGGRWGMSDPAHFSKLFRSVWGVSPTVCRRKGSVA